MTDLPSELPISKPTRVLFEAIRTACAVLAVAVNVTVPIVVLTR